MKEPGHTRSGRVVAAAAMRRAALLAAALSLVVGAAACGRASPNVTTGAVSAPSPVVTPAAAGDGVTPSPSGQAHGSSSHAGGVRCGGPTTRTLVAPPAAYVSGFQQTTLTVKANRPFTLCFEDHDAGKEHNVEIFTSNPEAGGSPATLFAPKDDAGITGPAAVVYRVRALPPGTYFFDCYYHTQQMQGSLVVR